MAKTMTKGEWHGFVSEGTRTAKLSTVRADGSPHVAPVWFLLDGDELVFNTGAGSVKGRNLTRDGRVAICVDDEEPPFAFVVLQGQAEVSDDVEQARHWATRIAARYMGEEQAEEFGRRNGVAGELTVRVRVNRALAVAGLTD
ncbi:PPOX class F420-dependent oxidoreductase [Streptomyces yaizuensis]|uniref:PPOX class F420-dependent oxidoreductase n=1 Tax=Streptomyces yaizuensis TaxID=2989713 RepID=A0ABQ5PA09_9ACTN|nr:PPOX class F420-dependent oxidoreductase [Streptomyces sp. YSPA8]GLF99405.1 PPOX class F420-dependent oxidoreductase [Streptomyces sp. YSPA8]